MFQNHGVSKFSKDLEPGELAGANATHGIGKNSPRDAACYKKVAFSMETEVISIKELNDRFPRVPTLYR
jgi:hypothetical protein